MLSGKLNINTLFYFVLPAYLIGGGLSFYNHFLFYAFVLISIFVSYKLKLKLHLSTPIIKDISFFIFIVIYSGFFAINYDSTSLTLWLVELIGLLCLIIMLGFKDDLSLDKVFNVVRITLTLLILVSLIQYIKGMDAIATFSNVNRPSYVLTSLSAFIFYDQLNKHKIYNIIILFFVLFILIINGSRFNLLTFLLLCIIYGYVAFKRINLGKSNWSVLILIFTLFFIFIMPFIIKEIATTDSHLTIKQQFESLKTGAKDFTYSSMAKRIILAQDAWNKFIDSKMLGIGLQKIEVKGLGSAKFSSYHNFYLSVLARYGILGFFILIYLFHRIIKKRRRATVEFKALITMILMNLLFAANSPSIVYSVGVFYFQFALFFLIYYKNFSDKNVKEN